MSYYNKFEEYTIGRKIFAWIGLVSLIAVIPFTILLFLITAISLKVCVI